MSERRSRPGEYWDHREAQWVEHRPAVDVPAQAEPMDEAAAVAPAAEVDVRSE